VLFADEALALAKGTHVLSMLPLAHMYGFSFEFLYEFCIGCHVHFLTKAPSPKILLGAIAAVRPSLLIAVPLIIEKIVRGRVFPLLQTPRMKFMLSIPGLRNIVHSKIRQQILKAFGGNIYEVVVGGAPLNKEVGDFLARINFPITVGYGMTECAPIICYEDWKYFAKGSCGKQVPRMEVKIDSPDPHNVAGEIICKGMNVMLGYYKNPEATAEAIDADGWLHTGDLGTIDRQGNVFIRGRKKNMLLGANGQNIYPEEIEDKVLSYTPFDECVVVQRGEKLVCLAYITDAAVEAKGISREEVAKNIDQIRNDVNAVLHKYANISEFEIRNEEFIKTPKKNIKRYLYS
jgi:long-chain acyl-CoA synthetase